MDRALVNWLHTIKLAVRKKALLALVIFMIDEHNFLFLVFILAESLRRRMKVIDFSVEENRTRLGWDLDHGRGRKQAIFLIILRFSGGNWSRVKEMRSWEIL